VFSTSTRFTTAPSGISSATRTAHDIVLKATLSIMVLVFLFRCLQLLSTPSLHEGRKLAVAFISSMVMTLGSWGICDLMIKAANIIGAEIGQRYTFWDGTMLFPFADVTSSATGLYLTITLPPNQGGWWDLIVDGPDLRFTLVVTGDGRTLHCQQAPHGGPACYRVPGSIHQFQITISAGGEANGLRQDIPIYINDVNTSGQGIFVGDLKLLLAIGTPPTPTPLPPSPTVGSGGGMPDCTPQQLISLGVTAPDGRLIAPAAISFQAVREEIRRRTGQDVLAILADVLRQPGFTTGKAGVAYTSWHKAGRALDLNQGGPFRRVQECSTSGSTSMTGKMPRRVASGGRQGTTTARRMPAVRWAARRR
jgi:hypothetical protein